MVERPGRNTNMNPPLRASSHSTSRTLDDARLDDAAEDVEPDDVADVDVEPLVDAPLDGDLGRPRIFGQRRLARPERAVDRLSRWARDDRDR